MSTTYDSMVLEASAHLIGCPNAIIASYYRKMATELCDFSRVWRAAATPITLVSGTFSYALVSPVTYAEVICPIGVGKVFTVLGAKADVNFMSYEMTREQYSAWPEKGTGTPQVYTRLDSNNVLLAPVPDGVFTTLKFDVLLRPTAVSTVWDDSLTNEFRRALFHGVVGELMLMPGRPWTDNKLALMHGKQWAYYRSLARTRATHDFNTSSVSVQMRPMA